MCALALAAAAAADARIVFLHGTMDRGDVLGLFAACDAYVSPHRAEGFGRTLAEAMLLGKPTATFEEIAFAARMAGADEFIQLLPQGYDTPLFEGGSNLSGGQRQRLSIARALLTQPPILILDEATSALDAESEAIIQANLTAIAQGRTMLIVSHRLSMLTMCHSIIVLEKGKLIGNAPHDELLKTCPIYADLWCKQNRHLMGVLQNQSAM
jgi:ATP-binding cassette subfamily B protein